MTRSNHSEAALEAPGRNVFLDKIALRLDVAADSLRKFADSLDGRDCLTADEADDLRHAVAEAATSLQVVEAITRHFAADLTAPGGISAESVASRRNAHHEAHFRDLATAALAGEIRA